jgi:ribosomal protein L21E
MVKNWGPFLSSAVYAIRSSFHTTLKETPGQSEFGRDIVLPIAFVADWGAIEQQHQKKMARNNRSENASRINHEYKVGDKVLIKKPGKHLRKLEAPRTGPHTVTVIYTNGNSVSKRVMFMRE